MHFVLPNLEKRLHLFASSIPEEDEDENEYIDRSSEEDDTTRNLYLSLRYFLKAAERVNISFKGGFRLHSFTPSAFAGPRYRYSKTWGSWNFRFTEDLTYYSDDGWESKTFFDLERSLPDSYFLRTNLYGRWHEYNRGYDYWISTDLFKTISDHKVLNYRLSTRFNTEPSNQLKSVLAGIRYRQRFWRNWLFIEISPQVVFRREDDFDASPGITLSLEGFFGKEYIDYGIETLKKVGR